MKNIIFLLLLPFAVTAQNLPIKNGMVFYEQIDSVTGASQQELYSRARIWVANAFTNSNDVIQVADRDAGQIIGKGAFDYLFLWGRNQITVTGTAFFTIRIDCRENKARIQIYGISARNEDGPISPIEGWNNGAKAVNEGVFKAVDKQVNQTLMAFSQAINTQAKADF
jgi:hypothetical protein